MTAEELHREIMKKAISDEIQNKVNLLGYILEDRPWGYAYEMRDKLYYKYLSAAVSVLQPKQVIEMGSDHGASTLSMLASLPSEGKIFSIDIRDGWEFVPRKASRLERIVGNYMDLENWPKDLLLEDTNLWLIDGDHDETHVIEQMDLYSPFFTMGTVVLFDDVNMYPKAFEGLRGNKATTQKEVHGNGFGILVK